MKYSIYFLSKFFAKKKGKIFPTIFVIYTFCLSPLLKGQHLFELDGTLQKIKIGKFYIQQKMVQWYLVQGSLLKITIWTNLLLSKFYVRGGGGELGQYKILFKSWFCTPNLVLGNICTIFCQVWNLPILIFWRGLSNSHHKCCPFNNGDMQNSYMTKIVGKILICNVHYLHS